MDSNIQDVGTEPPEFQESAVNGVGSSQSMPYIAESFWKEEVIFVNMLTKELYGNR
jgi:hypothetical protein